MPYIVVIFLTIAAVEIFKRLPLLGRFGELINVMNKSRRTISSRYISDHWKERVLLSYSLSILKLSTQVGLMIFFVVMVIVLSALLLDRLIATVPLTSDLLFSWFGIGLTTATAMLYLRVSKALEKK